MKIFVIFLIILLSGCNFQSSKKKFDFEIDNDISFEVFEKKLKEYSKLNKFPNIDD